MLDERLGLCADFVSGKGIACDVGTDHAYLASELILSGKCSHVIASDINEKPLEFAKNTIDKYNISDKVDLILSDGLKEIPSENVTDVIIAGMGGETIAAIIKDCDWLKYGVNLILQPMTKLSFLRKFLYDNGYEIKEEKITKDGDKFYIVMKTVWTATLKKLSEVDSIRGFLSEDSVLAQKYHESETERLNKISSSMESNGKNYESVHYKSLGTVVGKGHENISITDIYNYLDSLYPFNTQEKWDNSGLLVENTYMECSKILLTLDIDYKTCFLAYRYGAELIISHHPVIFEPLKRITGNSPVKYLVRNEISAICMHTNLDIANGGTNGVILKKLSERFEFAENPEPFEDCGNGNSLGWVCNLSEYVDAEELGKILKEIFGCKYVRMSTNIRKSVKRIAFCSGSGGSLLGLAMEKNCDAYITGDVKHDVWISANNNNITLYDCGHFHTENIVLEELRYVLEKKFPMLEIIIAQTSTDPVKYIM